MAGLISLVRDHGLREKVAREIMQVSERKGHAVYRIRYAPGYGTEKTAAPNLSTLAGGPDAPLEMD